MHCPFCRHNDSRVIDSRTTDDGTAIRRRRQCPECGRRFTTVESASLSIVKRSGATEPFSRAEGPRRRPQGLPGPPGHRGRPRGPRPARRGDHPRAGAAPRSRPTRSAWPSSSRSASSTRSPTCGSPRVYQAFDTLEDFEAAITLLRAERDATGQTPPSASAHRAAPTNTSTPAPQRTPRRVSDLRDRTRHHEAQDDRGRGATDDRDRQPRRGPKPARNGKGKGVTIERIYTTPGVHPYDEVTWETRDVVQQNWKTGETIFEQRGVEFPDFWSVNASTIVTTKYFRGALGTDGARDRLKQLIDRVVLTYVKAGRSTATSPPRTTPPSSSTS